MTIDTVTLSTPTGPLALLADGDTVVAAGFTADAAGLHARLSPARRARALRERGDLGELSKRVAAYLDGDLTAVEALQVDQSGTDFQRRVWQALRASTPGRRYSYTEMAAAAGNPRAPRAAGGACGANLIAPIVPCHRVVRADGGLGGYAWGLAAKRWLLAHEDGAG